jgi:hypothetical protein
MALAIVSTAQSRFEARRPVGEAVAHTRHDRALKQCDHACWAARRALLGCVLWAAGIGQVGAQPVPGASWRASYTSERAEPSEATLLVDEAAASWTTLPPHGQAPQDPCSGPFPVALVDSGASTVSLWLAASQVDPQCPDLKARLTVVDADTLEGEFEDGRILRLERVR